MKTRSSFELFCKLGPSSLLDFGFINCEPIIWPEPLSSSPGSFHLSGIIFLKISTGLKWSFLPDRNVLFFSKCQISSNTSNFENNKQSSTRPGSLFLKLENQRPFLSHGWNKDLNCFNLSWLLVLLPYWTALHLDSLSTFELDTCWYLYLQLNTKTDSYPVTTTVYMVAS